MPDNQGFDPNRYLKGNQGFDAGSYLRRSTQATLDKPSKNPVDIGFIEGEIPTTTRAALSFASNEAERRGYLRKSYPGIEFGQVAGDASQTVVRLPGEQKYKFVDDPSLTLKDAADFVGDVPSAVAGIGAGLVAAPSGPGSLLAAAGGAAAGEGARKFIGRELIGIPRGQTLLEDVADVGIAAGTGGVAQYGINKIPAVKNKIGGLLKPAAEVVDDVAPPVAPVPAVTTATESVANTPTFVQKLDQQFTSPKSIAEIQKRVTKAEKAGKLSDLPTADRLKNIEEILPDLENRPTRLHHEMLKDKTKQRVLGLMRERADEAGQTLTKYEQLMKGEAGEKLSSTVAASAGRSGPRARIEAGEDLARSVKAQYDANRNALSPIFEKFHNARLPKTKVAPDMQNRLATEIPQLNAYLKFDEAAENLVMAPYSPKMGITESAYSKLNSTIQALNSDGLTFRDLQHIREYLRQSLDPVNPSSTRILSDVRKVLLQGMEDWMAEYRPNFNVRETFKKYAINEKRLDQMESLLGGKLDSLDILNTANTDRALDRVFESSRNMLATREVVGEQKMRELAANYVYDLMQKSTDKGIFSSNRFMSAYRKKAPLLRRALGDQTADRIEALSDLMRIIPDSPSPNPSGTAAAAGVLKQVMRGEPKKALEGLIEKAGDAFEGRQARIQIDAMLADPSSPKGPSVLKKAYDMRTSPMARKIIAPGIKGGLIQESSEGLQEKTLRKSKR